MDIIAASNLSAGYGGIPLWRGANFTILKGEFVAILGPNGAGKTTLFRLLLGLAAPIAGKMTLFGAAPHRGNPRIGYVPQRHMVDREIAVEALELVRLGIGGDRWGLGAGRGKAERAEARHIINAVGADDLAHRALGTLSGGELQRIFLAEALAGKPELLLLDEPLANLDVRREGELVRLVRDVAQREQVTVLLIAHNINSLMPVLDRVLYVANGRIASGKPGEVLTSAALTELYGAPIEVLRDSKGRVAVLGVEEWHHAND